MVTNKNIIGVVLIIPVANFWVNSTSCPGEFHVVFQHFQDVKNVMLNILKEKLSPSCVGSFSFETV